MRGAVPIILAGNGYLLKHAPNVMGCAQLIAQVFKDAGIPQGVYGWLNADNDGVSQMIKDSRIAAVTVTGSTGQTDGGTSGMRWGVYQWLLCQRRASRLWWREEEWLWS